MGQKPSLHLPQNGTLRFDQQPCEPMHCCDGYLSLFPGLLGKGLPNGLGRDPQAAFTTCEASRAVCQRRGRFQPAHIDHEARVPKCQIGHLSQALCDVNRPKFGVGPAPPFEHPVLDRRKIRRSPCRMTQMDFWAARRTVHVGAKAVISTRDQRAGIDVLHRPPRQGQPRLM